MNDPTPALPALVRMAKCKAVFGFSPGTAYREAARGRLVLRKLGTATYIETASALALIAGLPTVKSAA